MPIVDLVAAGILALAVLRGLWIGLVREVFSIAALASAVFVVGRLAEPLAADLAASLDLDPLLATALAGGGLAVATILAVVLVGLLVRRLLRLSGLGLPDRIGGAILGAAEGTLFVAMLMFGAVTVIGRSDPLLAGTRTLAAYERLEAWVGADAAAPAEPR